MNAANTVHLRHKEDQCSRHVSYIPVVILVDIRARSDSLKRSSHQSEYIVHNSRALDLFTG